MFIAVAAFSFMDALLKTFSAHYPPLQVSAIRAAASLPFVLLPLCLAGRLAELRTRRPGMHLLRGLLGVAMLATFVFALSGTVTPWRLGPAGLLPHRHDRDLDAAVLLPALGGLVAGDRMVLAGSHRDHPLAFDAPVLQVGDH